jgi:predicted Zn-dependent peptidase
MKITKLKNNLNLITIPVKGTKAVTILVLLPVGSRYEKKEISGASHFVEHMMFKGTAKRPTAMDISRALEAEGADFNAFTYKDYTGYYVKINSERQEVAFDLLSDMIFNSKFAKEEMEREKGVIVEELRMYEDNPTMAIDLLFDQIMLGDQPLGWDIGGTIETVKKITREQLCDYYNNYYVPGNMVLVVAGDIAIGQKMKKLLEYFNQKNKNSKKTINLNNKFLKYNWPQEEIALAQRVAVKERKLDQTHMILGFPSISNHDPARYASALMTTILGVGMSSRLFVEVREKRGLAYMIRAGQALFRDVGVFQIQAGLDPARLKEAIKVIKDEILKISSESVTSLELKEAKSSIIGRMTLGAEDSSVLADWFGKQFWFNKKIETQADVFKKIKAVTISDVQKIAKKIFKMNEMRMAAIGSINKNEVLKML